MAFKAIVLIALLGLAASVPVEYGHGDHYDEHHDAPAHYEFSYSVHDPHTGDVKSQHETRHEDKVEGEYSLIEPDGHKRTVKYTADKHNGFNAHVEREGTSHHVPEVHHAAPVKYESHVPVAFATHHIAHIQPVAIAHHVPVKVASYGHATSHASIKIHHYDHH